LPKEVQGRIKSRLDKSRDEFAQLVSDGISISKSAVLDTEAQVFTGQEAIDIGFADKLVNGQEAVPLLLDVIKSNNSIGVSMSTDKNPPETAKTGSDSQLTQSDLDAAKAEGAKMERERIGAILNSDEAKSRTTMATHLALSTSMSSDEAVGLLKVSAKEGGQADDSAKGDDIGAALDGAMSDEKQPNLDTSGDADELSDIEKEEQALLSAHDSVFGK
ncbi:hypothetical protein N473_26600, partial [Pseudoalteromonas luteoviolacea CPMOR-1]